jgi:hypothetical protein
MGKGYHASKWRSVTYFVMVRATARRTLPVKGEDFLDSLAAVHESGYGPELPRRPTTAVAAFGRKTDSQYRVVVRRRDPWKIRGKGLGRPLNY